MLFLISEFLADYQKNVVEMVTEHVLKDVNSRLKRNPSRASHEFAAQRRSSVREWSITKFPLSYGDGFQQLTQALAISTVDVGKGLSFTQPEHISIEEFGRLLFDMGRPNQPVALSPPLWRTNLLLDTLRVTVQMFVCSVGQNVPQNRTMSDIFTAYVKVACGTHKINFGPWSAGGFPGSGSVRNKKVDRVVVPTVWCGFGSSPAPGLAGPVELMDNDQAVGYKLRMANHRAINNDTRAEWTANQIVMGEFPIHFKRTINPSDLTTAVAGIDDRTSPIVREVYEWVVQQFNINNPVHHLVLITAMLFQKARPYLDWPGDAKTGAGELIRSFEEDDDDDANRQKLRLSRYICQLDWCDARTDKNVLKEGEPFIPTFVVYFLAYYHEDSPFHNHIGAVPPGWTQKHSRFRPNIYLHQLLTATK
jgi:hypothetical protein